MQETLEWRREYMKPELHCALCVRDDKHHCFVRLGADRYGRPIMYVCPARSLNSDGPITMRHIVSELEAAFRDAAPGSADTWVWFADMRGFSIWGSGFSASLGQEFVRVRLPLLLLRLQWLLRLLRLLHTCVLTVVLPAGHPTHSTSAFPHCRSLRRTTQSALPTC